MITKQDEFNKQAYGFTNIESYVQKMVNAETKYLDESEVNRAVADFDARTATRLIGVLKGAASVLSDAQEFLAANVESQDETLWNDDEARKKINIAKHAIFEALEWQLYD